MEHSSKGTEEVKILTISVISGLSISVLCDNLTRLTQTTRIIRRKVEQRKSIVLEEALSSRKVLTP